MSKTPKKTEPRSLAKSSPTHIPSQGDFDAVLNLIESARTRAMAAVNTALIDLYWSVGEYICLKIAEDGWGKGTVESLAEAIHRRYPGMTGYSAKNLWRMRQFYGTYHDQPKLSAMLRELTWTHNLLILGKCKREEEREFYLRLTTSQKWTSRELERQINGALFERVALSPARLSMPLAELYPGGTKGVRYIFRRHPRGLRLLPLPPTNAFRG